MACLPNVRTLTLPANLATAHDYSLVRAPLHTMNRSSRTLMPPSKSLLRARRTALSRELHLERYVINELFSLGKTAVHPTNALSGAGKLQSVSFVRQVQEEDRLEYAVEYSRVPGVPGVVVRVLRPTGEEVIVPMVINGNAIIGFNGGEGERDDVDMEVDEMVSLWDPICSVAWSMEPLSLPDSIPQLDASFNGSAILYPRA